MNAGADYSSAECARGLNRREEKSGEKRRGEPSWRRGRVKEAHSPYLRPTEADVHAGHDPCNRVEARQSISTARHSHT